MPARSAPSKGTSTFAEQINAEITAKIQRTRDRDIRILIAVVQGRDLEEISREENTSVGNMRIAVGKMLRLLYFRCPDRAGMEDMKRPPTIRQTLENSTVWLDRIALTRSELRRLS